MNTQKITFVGLLLLVLLGSCQTKTDDDSQCTSQEFSNEQKKENSLFLDFYYGMTPDEFRLQEQKLIKIGALIHSDSTTKFLLVVNNDIPDKCLFVVTPSFDECALYAIDLEYIPTTNTYASLRSYSMGSSYESHEVPNISTANALESLYKDKYGRPVVSRMYGLGPVIEYKWVIQNKEVGLYKIFGISKDLEGKEHKQISGISIKYRSILFDKKSKTIQDSIDAIHHKRILNGIEKGKRAI
jgi:hypothetical protein